MSLGLGRAARRRQRRLRMLKWTTVVGVFLGLGAFSYFSGAKLAEIEVAQLRVRLDLQLRTVADLRAENEKLRQAETAARAKESSWRERHAREVPAGKPKELFLRMKEQIDKGASTERLAFMIDAAADTSTCEGQPVTKRFLVRTPLYAGASDSVTIADNLLTVTAEGPSATNSAGEPEAWFDPAAQTIVRFISLGGKRTSKVSGTLPLHHSVVIGGTEYRFTLVKGDRRGFIHVTADRCPLAGKNAGKTAGKTREAKRATGGNQTIIPATPPPAPPAAPASAE